MAKTQRWRRGRSAGDGTPAEARPEELSEETPTAAEAVLEADLEDAPETADVADAEAAPEPDGTDDAEEPEDAEDPHPPLPHVPDRSGLTGWLFGGRNPADVVPLQLLQAAHAKQAITTALAMGLVAAIAGRPAREAGVVLVTVLVGQTILGWHNDIVDRQRDEAHGLTGKPIAAGRLDPGTAWYAVIVGFLLLLPLATTTGAKAGAFYGASVVVAMLGNIVLRTGFLSWWSWAVSFALLPAYLSYGGWGGKAVGSPPEPAIVVLAALLGIGIHFTRAVWGLVADHEDGWTYLPLKLGLKLGATRLLALSTVYTVVVAVLLVVVGARVGLSR
ncbi:UbiA family prenyltransferase [Nocardioides carbamazepini]|uniref:UbiA family prenyltransferase n=1 Tax=Nocardioides carbamazepini TaxID=2854259 RepID=UPI00214A870C|nr:UbiA family prenyltransferase [Nocardioides carbamazepini]MCR1784086.1 UbiA family prenyltransferase [Nocardioides carbamazepini]